MKAALALITLTFLLGSPPARALDPSLDVSQYAHTAWTARDGFSLGIIYAMVQTPDGFLWLGSEFGLFRFDGVRFVPWQPPAGQHLPYKSIFSLLVTRDGTLWIGTFEGLVSWGGGKLTSYPELAGLFITSLLEDREGTVWASTRGPTGRLCAIRSGSMHCYGDDGAFGSFVWSLYQDSSGNLWVGADSGLWLWKPGRPKRYATSGMRIGDLSKTDDGRLLIGMSGAGLKQVVDDKVVAYPIHIATNPNALLQDRDVNSNRLLRDRDGDLWIGTKERGLIHVHHGRTDEFSRSDGLSGDTTCSLFEDREGNVWVATTGGLDRFRELPVGTIFVKQGLSNDDTASVIASSDGSMWVGTYDGLTRWRNGQTTIFRKASGLPDDNVQSLYEDYRGRVWALTGRGLAYFESGRFVAVNATPGGESNYITGDNAGNLWVSTGQGLWHFQDGRSIEQFPWSVMGRRQEAKVVLSDQGGVWLAFWLDGGVLYFKDGQVRTSYTDANGLGKGHVVGLQLGRDGALWAATEGGLSRIKEGRIATLTSRNGLPCDTIHSTIEDDEGSLWLYTACGLVRVTRNELDTWIADPTRRIETMIWDAAEGVKLHAFMPDYFGPPAAKSSDGKLWFLTGEGVQTVDPRHLAFNRLPPPVYIEKVVADRETYWENLPGAGVANVRLPPRVRDLTIDYTALSLVAPEKVHFKYKLEGQDSGWREVVNDREVQYSNLPPRLYRFRVIASNNSGVWNEEGASLDFVIPPAWYQTYWFFAVCVAAFVALVWALYQYRLHQLARQFNMRLEERVGERTRIARDLHDTLLQSFHGVLLFLQSGIHLMPEHPSEGMKTLKTAAEHAERAILEGRQAVQGLRASTVERNDLALAIKTLGGEIAAADSSSQRPEFAVQVEGVARNLHPILRDEVFRIAGEAMRNAFRHAGAKQIEVEIHYDDRRLRVRMRDDGKGIDSKLLSDDGREGHFGLRGMRERAKLIGGKLTVWSELDSGTEVELSIPASRAYTAADGQRSWLAEKFAKLSGKDTELKS